MVFIVRARMLPHDDIVVDFAVEASEWTEVVTPTGCLYGNGCIVLEHTTGMRLCGTIASGDCATYTLSGTTLEDVLRTLPMSCVRRDAAASEV